MPEEKIINQRGYLEAPTVPDRSVPRPVPVSTQTPGSQLSFNDYFNQTVSNIKPGVSSIPLSSVYTGNRYASSRPGQDLEEMYAQQQGIGEKFLNGAIKMTGTAASSFLAGTAGLLYGVNQVFETGKLSSLYDNEVNNKADEVNKYFEDALPNFYSTQERDAEWWSPDNLLTGNFWSDKVMKNLGYSLGALGGGALWAKALGAIGITNRLVQAGRGMETATAVEEAMSLVPQAEKYTAFDGALTSVAQKYLKNPFAQNILKNGERVTISTMGALGEGSIESLQNMNNFRANAIEEFKRVYGRNPQGEELDNINDYASQVGNNTLGANFLLLSATNYLQLPKILGSSRRFDKALINELEQKEVSGVVTAFTPKTILGKAAVTTRNLGGLVFSPSEAFEEGAQYAIQTGVYNFFDKAYKNREDTSSLLTGMYGAMGNIFGEGVDQALSTKEGLESMLIGGISGGIQQARGEVKERGFLGTGGQRAVNTEIAIAALNNSKIQDVLRDQVKYVGIGIGSQKARQNAILANDVLEEKDAEHDYTLSYLMPRIKYGKEDFVAQELGYYKTQAATQEGFNELVNSGIVNPNETRPQFNERLNNLEALTKSVAELYTVVEDRYADVRDENGKPVYNPSVMDKMVYAMAKINNYDQRIPQVNNSLLASGINTTDVLQSLIKDKKVNVAATKEALAQINDLDVVSETKDRLKENLSDVMEMSLRRKLYIDEYDKIKNNPEDYQDVEELPIGVTEQPAAIVKQDIEEDGKTKTIGKELEIGKEYSLSQPAMRIGNQLYLAPKMTVLATTLGGEFEVKMPDGSVTYLKPDDFKAYKLSEADNSSKEINDILNDVIDAEVEKAEGLTELQKIAANAEGVDKLEVVNSFDNPELMNAIEKSFAKKAKAAFEKLEKARQEEEELKKNEALNAELVASLDTQGELLEGGDREPDSKKSDANVMNGTINSDNIVGNDRANQFGFNLDNFPNRDKIRGVYVTYNNEDKLIPGLTQYLKDQGGEYAKDVDPKETIAMVLVQQNEDGSLQLVDKNGEVIPEGANALENAVFQVKPGPGLKWSKAYTKGGSTDMFRKTTPEETKELLRNQYDAWRKSTIASTEISTFPVNSSFGIPMKLTDDNGKEIQDGRAGAIEAGLITEDELANGPVITIPTTNDTLTGGTSSFKNPIAKAFLKVGNEYVKLDNRRISEKEANLLFKVIHKIAENAQRDGNIQSLESQRLIKYLRSVVYWGTPTTPQGESKPAGNNSVWFDNGMLLISNPVQTFPFAPQALENSKDEIVAALTGIFNNANLSMIKSDDEYAEITNITDAGEIQTKRWPNYQSFLLSGKDREGSEIPLSVNMRPGVNRKGIYFIDKQEADKFAAPVPAPKPVAVKPILPGAPKKTQAPAADPVADIERRRKEELKAEANGLRTARKGDKGIFWTQFKGARQDNETDREVEVEAVSKYGVKFKGDKDFTNFQSYFYFTNTTKAQQINAKYDAELAALKPKAPAQPTVIDLTGKKANSVTIPTVGTIEFTLDAAANQADPTAGFGFVSDSANNTAAIEALMAAKGIDANAAKGIIAGSILNKYKSDIAAYVAEEEDELEFTIPDAFDETYTASEDERMNSQMNDEADDEVLRAIVSEQAKQFEGENWTQLEGWLKANFPNVPVYRVKNVITATNGMQAWGMLKDGAIYLYQNAEAGTAYHEVFEAVWKMFTSPQERQDILNEFKSRKGSFVDRPTGRDVKFSEATDLEAKEQLAEEFREYTLNPKVEGPKSFIGQLFHDLVKFIKEFFTGPTAVSNTDKLFKKIGTGYYKQYSPMHSSLSFAKKGFINIEDVYASDEAEYSIANFTGAEQHDLIQQMTYLTLKDLVVNNKSLFKVNDLYKKKSELYAKLKEDLQKTVLKSKKAALANIANGTMTKEEAAPIIAKSNAMWKAIDNEENWNQIAAKHQERLKSYNIEFDENDELVRNEEDKTKEINDDATKIDLFRKINPAVKLLLSTLPYVKKNDTNGKLELIYSSINGVQLIPSTQAYMAIMNRVNKSRNLEEMMEGIRALANDDINYQTIYTRLTKNSDLSQPADLSKLNNIHDIQLLAAFWRSFKKQSPNVKNVFVLENGEVVVGDSNFTTAARQASEEFMNNIRKVLQGKNNPYFTYNAKDRVYEGKKGSTKSISFDAANDSQQIAMMTAFLRQFGIVFNPKDILSDKITSGERDMFKEATIYLRDSIGKGQKMFKIDSGKNSLDITGRLRQLSEIKAKIDNPEFSSTYYNVKGERTQTFIGTNAASDLYDMLSQISNKSELRNTQYEYLLDDVFSANSVILKKMFNPTTGAVNKSALQLMKPSYADGLVNLSTGKRKQSSKLTYKERLTQELNMNLAGYYLNLVPGDSSMEWMLYMGNPITKDNLLDGYDKVYDIFQGYFIDEMNLARANRPVAKGRVSSDMRFMKAVLGDTLHDKLIKKEGSPEEIYEANKEDIDAAVLKFISTESSKFRSVLMNYGVLTQNEENNYNIEGVAVSKKNNLSPDELFLEMNALNASYIINNIEMHKLIYSDPYQYSDELKRIKNFNSPRQAIINSSVELNKAMNRVWNKGYKKGDIGNTDFNKDFFKTVTLSDVMGTSSLEGYGTFEETDGGGFITLKAYRNFRIRAGEWNENEELQYKYDVAFEKNKKDIALSSEEAAIYEAGNPQVKSAYTPLKPIVSGNKADGEKYNDVMLDKFALYPLSYRIAYELNPESNAVKMYDKMQTEGVDYAVYNSGRKVGANKSHDLYNADGSFNTNEFTKENTVKVPFAIMSIQSEVPSKDTALVTRGSQVTKLITMDYMEAGVPVDFKEGSSFAERYKAWNDLKTEEAKEKASPLYKEVKNNQKFLELITENGFNTLLDKLGIKIVDGKYEVDDFAKMTEILRQEILKREVNDNITSALADFDKAESLVDVYQQINTILYSIADKNVISPKISGGMKVQIPSTLLESVRAKKEGGAYTSDVLGFYEKDGKHVAEIMVGRWFDTDMTDADLLEYLNTTPEGQKILSGLAFRIPTQNKNSIDAFVIKQFLPKEFGDSVVIPSALVKKVGSDFDIDKLSIYFKNVYPGVDGKPTLVEYKGSEEATKDFYGKVYDKLSEKEDYYIKKELERLALADDVDYDTDYESATRDAEERLMLKQESQASRRDAFVDNMYRKSLENEYIQSSENLVTNDRNFDQLVKPNSADQLKKLSNIVSTRLRSESFDYTAVGNLLNRSFMSRLRQAFVSGKYAIGIAAVSQTNHSLNQRQPIIVDRLRMVNMPLQERQWLGDGIVKFQKYNRIAIDGKTYPTLSMINNAATKPQNISDILGQFIDGYVDISKGPWIMELGATPNVASTWLFLTKLGVPINTVAFFMNQPIIREYLRSVENAGYSWLFIDDIVESTKANYRTSKDLISKMNVVPGETELLNMVGKKNLTTSENAAQQFMLDEFLKYAKMAEQLFNVTQGSNFDTSTFNNPYLVFKKQEQLKKAQQSIVTSVDDLLENSFIGKLNEIINETRNALATVLTSDKQNVRTVIEKTLTPYTNLPDREFVKLAQKAVNDLFDWAVQTDRRINTNLANILVNKEDSVSTARRILEFKEDVMSNPEHPLYRNHVINLIDAKLSDVEGGIDNISIKNKDNKAYDQNQMIYGFREIKEYLNGSDNNLYGALVRLAVVQSGLSNSPISFTSLLPYEDFKEVYGRTMATIEEKENLSDYHTLAVFQRNNWADDDVTPYRKAKRTESGNYNNNMKFAPKVNLAVIQGKLPKMLKLDSRAREANKDVIVYQWQDQNLTPAEQKLRDEKKARGDYSYINKGLFQKVYTDEAKTEALTIKDFYGNTQYVYKMINAWGDSFKANEFYTVARPSAFTENGFLPVQYSVEETQNGLTYTSNEVSDAAIVPYFVSPKTEEVAPEEEVVAKDAVTNPVIEVAPKKVVTPPNQLSLFNDAEVSAVINKKEKESERCNAK
jgi:hypothetical protein